MKVVDLPFPQIDPMADTDALRALVDEYVSRIEALHGDVVLAAGEFTFLVGGLSKRVEILA